MSKAKSSSTNLLTSNKQTLKVANSVVSSFDSKCMIEPAAVGASSASATSSKQKAELLAQQQLKKKRTALENISNASSGLGNNLAASSTNIHTEMAKKSRFGAGHHAPPPPNAIKKSDSISGSRKNMLSSSKENLSNILPNTLLNKKTSVSTTTTGAASHKSHSFGLVKQHSLSASSTTTVKTEKICETKQETVIKIEQVKTETSSCEVHLERQLATTSIKSEAECLESLKCEIASMSECVASSSSSDSLLSITSSSSSSSSGQVEDWEDIDVNDTDEFNVGDYVSYIFKYYREREAKFVVDDYIRDQPNINRQMRLLLVDWMVEVQQQLEFNHEVLYLSVKLLDLYLNSRRIEKEKLQLLGGAAMFIACKFEERMPPIIDDFIYVSDSAYDRKELIKMEIDILKTVRFDIGAPLSYTFLRRYSKCVKADMKFLTLARYILELSLQEYSFAFIRDSLKACAALYLALKMAVRYEKGVMESIVEKGHGEHNVQPPLTVSTANLAATEWNATLTHYTGSNLDDFIHLLPQMNSLIQAAPLSKYKTVFKKYSHQVFYEVAKISPLSATELESLHQNRHNVTKSINRKL